MQGLRLFRSQTAIFGTFITLVWFSAGNLRSDLRKLAVIERNGQKIPIFGLWSTTIGLVKPKRGGLDTEGQGQAASVRLTTV